MKRLYSINQDTLEYEEETESVKYAIRELEIKLYGMIAISILLVLNLAYTGYQFNKSNNTIAEQQKTISALQIAENKEFNLKIVDKYIDGLPFKDKAMIKRQYRLESANLTSTLCRTNKNLFGMRNADGKRKYRQIGTNGGEYRKYKDWRHSIHDRLDWEQVCGNMKVYATDPDYLCKLSLTKNQKYEPN